VIHFARRWWPRASILLGMVMTGACSTPSALEPVDGGDADTVAVVQGDDDSPDGDSDAGVDGPGCDPAVTYATFGRAFFDTYCNRCHRFDQQSAQLAGDAISSLAGTGTFMPPVDPRPTAAERASLVAWIACGAP
jgi:hypothetical protein